uniref:Uncharacterized protein n=1 Tax=Vespula pensylvanica TaxID=30213 RepID=A0A834PGC5_VESPE|nr:hypothetical protein H0235_001605 [Vespula pensylvanica]
MPLGKFGQELTIPYHSYPQMLPLSAVRRTMKQRRLEEKTIRYLIAVTTGVNIRAIPFHRRSLLAGEPSRVKSRALRWSKCYSTGSRYTEGTATGHIGRIFKISPRKAPKLFGSQCKLITTFKSSNISRRGSPYCKADGLDRNGGIGGDGASVGGSRKARRISKSWKNRRASKRFSSRRILLFYAIYPERSESKINRFSSNKKKRKLKSRKFGRDATVFAQGSSENICKRQTWREDQPQKTQ